MAREQRGSQQAREPKHLLGNVAPVQASNAMIICWAKDKCCSAKLSKALPAKPKLELETEQSQSSQSCTQQLVIHAIRAMIDILVIVLRAAWCPSPSTVQ